MDLFQLWLFPWRLSAFEGCKISRKLGVPTWLISGTSSSPWNELVLIVKVLPRGEPAPFLQRRVSSGYHWSPGLANGNRRGSNPGCANCTHLPRRRKSDAQPKYTSGTWAEWWKRRGLAGKLLFWMTLPGGNLFRQAESDIKNGRGQGHFPPKAQWKVAGVRFLQISFF